MIINNIFSTKNSARENETNTKEWKLITRRQIFEDESIILPASIEVIKVKMGFHKCLSFQNIECHWKELKLLRAMKKFSETTRFIEKVRRKFLMQRLWIYEENKMKIHFNSFHLVPKQVVNFSKILLIQNFVLNFKSTIFKEDRKRIFEYLGFIWGYYCIWSTKKKPWPWRDVTINFNKWRVRMKNSKESLVHFIYIWHI